MKEILNQFIKFCTVGFFGALLNYSTFFVLYNYFSVYYILSSGIGFVLSVFLAFYLNKKYTFKITEKYKITLIKYFLVNIFTLFLGLISLAFLVEILEINVYISNLLIIGIQTSSNFIGSKLFVFKRSLN